MIRFRFNFAADQIRYDYKKISYRVTEKVAGKYTGKAYFKSQIKHFEQKSLYKRSDIFGKYILFLPHAQPEVFTK